MSVTSMLKWNRILSYMKWAVLSNYLSREYSSVQTLVWSTSQSYIYRLYSPLECRLLFFVFCFVLFCLLFVCFFFCFCFCFVLFCFVLGGCLFVFCLFVLVFVTTYSIPTFCKFCARNFLVSISSLCL